MEDIRIDVLDFCLQDIGSATYTEYDLDATTASYIANHIDTLLGAKVALLHSHNNMNAFFSGTDLNTLHEQAAQCNNTLSIVVNNAGNYVAKFTQKETAHQVDNVTTDSTIDVSYSLLGETNKIEHKTLTDFKTSTSDSTTVRVYDCDILRPLNVPIDKDFQQECINKEREISLKKNIKHQSVEDVIFKNTDRHYSQGWLFDDYKEVKSINPQHDIDLLARSILFLSLDIRSLKAPRHTVDVPLYHVSEDVIPSFLDAWLGYFFPDAAFLHEDAVSTEELSLLQETLVNYFRESSKEFNVQNNQQQVLEIIDNYKLYF